jgi:hypothetical protein
MTTGRAGLGCGSVGNPNDGLAFAAAGEILRLLLLGRAYGSAGWTTGLVLFALGGATCRLPMGADADRTGLGDTVAQPGRLCARAGRCQNGDGAALIIPAERWQWFTHGLK